MNRFVGRAACPRKVVVSHGGTNRIICIPVRPQLRHFERCISSLEQNAYQNRNLKSSKTTQQSHRDEQHGSQNDNEEYGTLLELFGPSIKPTEASKQRTGNLANRVARAGLEERKPDLENGEKVETMGMHDDVSDILRSHSPNTAHSASSIVRIPEGFDWKEPSSTKPKNVEVLPMTRKMMLHVSELLDAVSINEDFKHQCKVVEFASIFQAFRQFVQTRSNFPELYDALLQFNIIFEENYVREFLLPFFNDFARQRFPQDAIAFEQIKRFADLTDVKRMYPGARNMQRKIFFHAGPTNSGKTHHALQRLKSANHGVYAAPLRLLAQEIYHRLNSEGVKCNLYTGQEIHEVPLATHSSLTVEMMNTEDVYEVLVIDEIQMIGDRDRGKSWTKALIGARAAEIHLCGDPVVLGIVQKICGMLDEEVNVVSYDRLNELQVIPRSLGGDVSAIEDQDCIIAFSRREIFNIKRIIEMKTDKRCCVIYGSLPPETRVEQAKLFNDPNSGYNVLIASDAIGMGLNLNIRRVLFHRLQKFDGVTKSHQPVDHLLVKQIAGRAGRKKYYDVGMVTTFFDRDYTMMVEKLNQPSLPLQQAGIHPDFEQIEAFAEMLPEGTFFSEILERYATMSMVHTDFFLCEYEDAIFKAKLMDDLDMPLRVKYTFANCPMPIINPLGKRSLQRFASLYAYTKDMIPLELNFDSVSRMENIDLKMQQIELFHKIIDSYLWLANKYPLRFDAAFANEAKKKLKSHLNIGLNETTSMNKLRIDDDGEGNRDGKQRRTTRTPPGSLDSLIHRLFN